MTQPKRFYPIISKTKRLAPKIKLLVYHVQSHNILPPPFYIPSNTNTNLLQLLWIVHRDQQLNNQPANLSLYSQHRSADDYPAASSSQSSVTVYPQQPTHHQMLDSMVPSPHNSASVYPQRQGLKWKDMGLQWYFVIVNSFPFFLL